MNKADGPISADASGRSEPVVRVVLVGRSDAERRLRRMPAIELIRARQPLAAIGESVVPPNHGPPDRTTILVAPGTVPADRAATFASAIRRANPAARIIALDGPAAAGFHGTVASADDDEQFLSQLAGTASMAEPGDEPVMPASPPPEIEPEPAHRDPAGAIVSAMLRGANAIEEAMRGVRQRLGVSNAAFVPASRAAPDARPPTGGVAVRFGDRVLGHLVAPRADRAVVEAEAAALAPWAALAAQHEQLKLAAFVDDLTGAWNRRYFERFLGAAITKARDARHSVAVLYFDLDNFKIYNDRYGHSAGDEILIETVKLLRSVIRPSDRVCRIGGDEFAVIFYDPAGPRDPGRGQAPSEIGPIARRFQQQICRHRFPKLGDEAPGTLTISGGMAAFPWDGSDVQTLLERADQLALQSKRMGKNAITLGPGAERVCSLDSGEKP